PVAEYALWRRGARPLARYASDGADAVHVGIEGAEDVALARRFAHAADLARLQQPRAEPGHLLVEPLSSADQYSPSPMQSRPISTWRFTTSATTGSTCAA